MADKFKEAADRLLAAQGSKAAKLAPSKAAAGLPLRKRKPKRGRGLRPAPVMSGPPVPGASLALARGGARVDGILAGPAAALPPSGRLDALGAPPPINAPPRPAFEPAAVQGAPFTGPSPAWAPQAQVPRKAPPQAPAQPAQPVNPWDPNARPDVPSVDEYASGDIGATVGDRRWTTGDALTGANDFEDAPPRSASPDRTRGIMEDGWADDTPVNDPDGPYARAIKGPGYYGG